MRSAARFVLLALVLVLSTSAMVAIMLHFRAQPVVVFFGLMGVVTTMAFPVLFIEAKLGKKEWRA